MKSRFKGKVLHDLIEYRKREKERQELIAKEKFNKLKVYKFPAKDKINMKKHFYIHKLFIQSPSIPIASIAVYPVLCGISDFDKIRWEQISQANLAKKAGIAINSAKKGVEGLIDERYNFLAHRDKGARIRFLEKKMVSKDTRHFYVYKVGFVRMEIMDEWRKYYFPFYTVIIESGIWAKLSLRAKALYLAMRSTAYFDIELYCDMEDIPVEIFEKENGELREADYYEIFTSRKWDICALSNLEVCKTIGAGYNYPGEDQNYYYEDENGYGSVKNVNRGMSNNGIPKVVKELEGCRLVESFDNWYKVFLKPKGF